MELFAILMALLQACGTDEVADCCDTFEPNQEFLTLLEKERLRIVDMDQWLTKVYGAKSEYYAKIYAAIKTHDKMEQERLNEMWDDANDDAITITEELMKLKSVKMIQKWIEEKPKTMPK